MKKPALLLCVFLALQVLPAQAAMIVNDHFDGGKTEFDNSWSRGGVTARSFNYSVDNSRLTMNRIIGWGKNGRGPASVKFYQPFDPIDDFEAEFNLSWSDAWLSSPRVGRFGLSLFDSNNNLVSSIFYYDVEEGTGQDHLRVGAGNSFENHGDLPQYGSGIGSMIRQDGILSFYWDDVLLTSMESLGQATRLELFFSNPHTKRGWQNMTRFSVDYVTLESDPADPSATPEPGTLALLGSALALGAWFFRRKHHRRA